MEVEFNWRVIFLVFILAMLILAGLILVPHFLASSRNPVVEVTSVVTDTPLAQEVVANPVDIEFRNESDWQVSGVEECLPRLKSWLGDRYPLSSLTVVMTNTVTPEMAVGIVVPDKDDKKTARLKGICKNENGDSDALVCVMAVKQGGPGNELSVAATVEMAWLIQEFYRPKTKSSWEEIQNQKQGFEIFQPLIIKEDNQWVSDCLHLAR